MSQNSVLLGDSPEVYLTTRENHLGHWCVRGWMKGRLESYKKYEGPLCWSLVLPQNDLREHLN